MSQRCRLCCKTLFAGRDTNFPSCRCDNRIIMWGTTSSSDELTGDFDSRLKVTSIGSGCLFRLSAGNYSHSILGVLQHGVIPESSQTRARESALQESMGPASCGLATMESGNGILCRT